MRLALSVKKAGDNESTDVDVNSCENEGFQDIFEKILEHSSSDLGTESNPEKY